MQSIPIDTVSSRILIHVSKAGLFSAFGDNHEVEALISEGSIDESNRRVQFTVDARQIKVLDPELAPDKRRQVQETMLSPQVLDVARFPQITFRSTGVERDGAGRLLVHGELSLHGVTRPVVVSVTSAGGRYRGVSRLKQRDFGITPVSVAGGTIKVKDELKIEFDVATRAAAAGGESK